MKKAKKSKNKKQKLILSKNITLSGDKKAMTAFRKMMGI